MLQLAGAGEVAPSPCQAGEQEVAARQVMVLLPELAPQDRLVRLRQPPRLVGPAKPRQQPGKVDATQPVQRPPAPPFLVMLPAQGRIEIRQGGLCLPTE